MTVRQSISGVTVTLITLCAPALSVCAQSPPPKPAAVVTPPAPAPALAPPGAGTPPAAAPALAPPGAGTPAGATANRSGPGSGADAKTFTPEELEQIVATIALYPDSLVAQIFMASTYPLEVVQAERWLKENPKLKDNAAELNKLPWDASVKSLLDFPQVLD